MTVSKETADQHLRILRELLKQPGNDNCADCHTPHPRWASWNLGIFLCVSCAAVHRKMGPHISKVRSVTLDTWTKEQVESMKAMGNLKSNALYNPDTQCNPPPTNMEDSERDSEREAFIRKKYQHKSFQNRQPKPSSVKDTEQKRRDSIKQRFDDLRSLLPPITNDPDSDLDEPRIPGSQLPRSSKDKSGISLSSSTVLSSRLSQSPLQVGSKLQENRLSKAEKIQDDLDEEELAEFFVLLDELGLEGPHRSVMMQLRVDKKRHLISQTRMHKSVSSTDLGAVKPASVSASYGPSSWSTWFPKPVPHLTGDDLTKRMSLASLRSASSALRNSSSPLVTSSNFAQSPFRTSKGSLSGMVASPTVKPNQHGHSFPFMDTTIDITPPPSSPPPIQHPTGPQSTAAILSGWWSYQASSSSANTEATNNPSNLAVVDSKTPKTPGWYVTELISESTSSASTTTTKLVKHLILLRVQLSTATLAWIEKFVREKGMYTLGDVLASLVGKSGSRNKFGEDDELVLVEILKCFRVLLNMELGVNQVRQSPTHITHIAFALYKTSHKIRTLASELLAALCLLSLDKLVLGAFSDYRIAHGENFRFDHLVESLRLSEGVAGEHVNDEEGIWKDRAASMMLVNALTNSSEILEDRIALREEFGRRGLNEVIDALKYIRPPNPLLMQLEVYTQGKREDEEDMREDAREAFERQFSTVSRQLAGRSSPGSNVELELALDELSRIAKQHRDIYPLMVDTLKRYRRVMERELEPQLKSDLFVVLDKFVEHAAHLDNFSDDSWREFVQRFGASVQHIVGSANQLTLSVSQISAEEELEQLRLKVDALTKEKDELRNELSILVAENNTLRALQAPILSGSLTGKAPSQSGGSSQQNLQGLVQRLVQKEKQVIQLQADVTRLEAQNLNGGQESDDNAKHVRDKAKLTASLEYVDELKAKVVELETDMGLKTKEAAYHKRALESIYSRCNHPEEEPSEVDALSMATKAIEVLMKKEEEIVGLTTEVSRLTKEVKGLKEAPAIAAKRNDMVPTIHWEREFRARVTAPPPPAPVRGKLTLVEQPGVSSAQDEPSMGRDTAQISSPSDQLPPSPPSLTSVFTTLLPKAEGSSRSATSAPPPPLSPPSAASLISTTPLSISPLPLPTTMGLIPSIPRGSPLLPPSASSLGQRPGGIRCLIPVALKAVSTIGPLIETSDRPISSVAISPNGDLIAVASGDSFYLYQSNTNSLLLEGHHTDEISSITFSPNGRRVASGLWDSSVWIWDIMARAHVTTLKGHHDTVSCVAFAPLDSVVLSGSWDQTIRVCNFLDGKLLSTLVGHSDYVSSVGYASDGTRIFSGSFDQTIRLWDSLNYSSLTVIETHIHAITSLALRNDNRHLLCGSLDGTLSIWDSFTSEMVEKACPESGSLSFISFNGSFAILGNESTAAVELWVIFPYMGYIGCIDIEGTAQVTSAIFSEDGGYVLFGYDDGSFEYFSFEALISRVAGDQMLIGQPESPNPAPSILLVSLHLLKRLEEMVKHVAYYSQQFLLIISDCKALSKQLMSNLNGAVTDQEASDEVSNGGLQLQSMKDVFKIEALMAEFEVDLGQARALSNFDKLSDLALKIYRTASWIRERPYWTETSTEWRRRYKDSLIHDLDQLIEQLVEDITSLDTKEQSNRSEDELLIHTLQQQILTHLVSSHRSFQWFDCLNKNFHRATLLECTTFFHEALYSRERLETIRDLPSGVYLEFLQQSVIQCGSLPTNTRTEGTELPDCLALVSQFHEEWVRIGHLIGITTFASGPQMYDLVIAMDTNPGSMTIQQRTTLDQPIVPTASVPTSSATHTIQDLAISAPKSEEYQVLYHMELDPVQHPLITTSEPTLPPISLQGLSDSPSIAPRNTSTAPKNSEYSVGPSSYPVQSQLPTIPTITPNQFAVSSPSPPSSSSLVTRDTRQPKLSTISPMTDSDPVTASEGSISAPSTPTPIQQPNTSRSPVNRMINRGADLELAWTSSDPRQSQLYFSSGICYRFDTTSTDAGKLTTTLWRVRRPGKEDRIARLEWGPNGTLGRAIIGRNAMSMSDLVKQDPSANATSFTGPDGFQYWWCREENSEILLQDQNHNIIAFFRPFIPPKKYNIGDVYGELCFISDATVNKAFHPPLMNLICLTAMLNRLGIMGMNP